ncbi:MAG: hypothetical protein WBE72_13285 [Terracidiphilus sp.]
MGAPRRLAAGLLRAVVRLAPGMSRDWALAVLRELDFIEGEWAALNWALGSATAVLRHAARGWLEWMTRKRRNQEERMNSTGKKALGFASGMLLALLLALSGFGLVRIIGIEFPGHGMDRMHWPHFVGAIVIPEIIFVVAAILLWRKRTAVAAGILFTAAGIGIHVAVHLAMR